MLALDAELAADGDAAWLDDDGAVALALQTGLEHESSDESGVRALLAAVEAARGAAAVRRVLALQVGRSFRNDTALHVAASVSASKVALVLEHVDADAVHARDVSRETPLFRAVHPRFQEMPGDALDRVRLLVQAGASLRVRNESECGLLHECSDAFVLDAFLSDTDEELGRGQAGSVNDRDSDGITPVHS